MLKGSDERSSYIVHNFILTIVGIILNLWKISVTIYQNNDGAKGMAKNISDKAAHRFLLDFDTQIFTLFVKWDFELIAICRGSMAGRKLADCRI